MLNFAHTVSWSDVVTWLFVIANGGRILAYLPQIVAAWTCPAGARSVSILTWSYFAFAHLTALLYALFILQDLRSIWVFVGNLAATLCLVGLLLWKRSRHRRKATAKVDRRRAAENASGVSGDRTPIPSGSV